MWRQRLGQVLVAGVGLVNLAPAVGAGSVSTLELLYDVEVSGADAELMLRHRAVLLGLVGAGLLVSAAVPALRRPAIVGGAVSMGSYVVLHVAVDGTNAAAGRVLTIDLAALAALGLGATLLSAEPRR